MLNRIRVVLDVIIFTALVGTVFFLYQTYATRVTDYLFGEQTMGMTIRDVSLIVSVADTQSERNKGLSGVESMQPNVGKLFVFEKEGDYGFWMKDMLIPLDIIWINSDRKIVHIEENVLPESYPAVYGSPEEAQYVLELNAFFVSTYNIELGDPVSIPGAYLPADLNN